MVSVTVKEPIKVAKELSVAINEILEKYGGEGYNTEEVDGIYIVAFSKGLAVEGTALGRISRPELLWCLLYNLKLEKGDRCDAGG